MKKIMMFCLSVVLCLLFLLQAAPLPAAAAEAGRGEEVVLVSRAQEDDWDDFESAFSEPDSERDVYHQEALIADPLEPFNRGVFWVNDKLYFYAIKPVARGFRVVPRPARVSVKNFFFNLGSPVRIGNCLLQFKFRDFGTEVYRFVINSTFGVAGLFDVADSYAGVKPTIEDFGQTLGFYGFGHGFYLVLPIVGPSSLRDATGSFVDSYADPLRYSDLESFEYVGIKTLDVENRLSLDQDTYEGIVRDSLDPYLFIRSAYAQRRLAQVGKNGYNLNIFSGPLFDGDWLNPLDWFGVH